MTLVAVTLLWFTTLGACFGSLLNVFVYRLPLGKSMVRPPSSCPQCSREIAWYDNIPVISWLVLRGRCRWCQTAISIRYPLVEAVVSLEWTVVFFWLIVRMRARQHHDWADAVRAVWELASPRMVHESLGLALLLYWLTGVALFVIDRKGLPRAWTIYGVATGIVWTLVWVCLPRGDRLL